MAFGKGDRIRIKAGAKIYSLNNYGEVTVAEKSKVVTIKDIGVVLINPGMPTHGNAKYRQPHYTYFYTGRTGNSKPGIHTDAAGKVNYINKAALAWGVGAAEECDCELVQKAADVEVKERKQPVIKEKPLEFRMKVKKGSKWIATKDLQCWVIDYDSSFKTKVKFTGLIKSGEEFKVASKPETFWVYSDTKGLDSIGITFTGREDIASRSVKMANGKQAYSVTVEGPNASGNLVIYEMEQGCKPKDEDQIFPIYYVLDTETNKYMGKAESVVSNYNWKTIIPWKDTLRGARKFKRIADVRSFALNGSGYYDKLRNTGNLPEWLGGPKQFDVKESWIIVEVDQNTNKEIRRIELYDTFKRSWALREITQKYGSSARTLYSNLEKKGQLNDWKYIISFSHEPEGSYRWVDELSRKEIDEIEDMLSIIDKSLFSKAQTDDGYAVAVKDAPEITLMQLSYSGEMNFGIIDIESLTLVTKEKQFG